MKLLRLFIAAAICIGLSGAIALAGTTGKITGTVVDADTKEPLPGAVVTILGTTLGANTDLDGRYMILNVPVGTYTVQAKMMGFQTNNVTNVKAIMDLTTTVNFKLSSRILESGTVVEIRAKRVMVEPSATSKTTIMNTDDIMALPGGNATSAIGQTAGIVTSNDGYQHVRGGRSDEMAYFIDNVVVNDPLQGRVGAQINTGAIQEVMVITGGFNAEYGEAMSGVVNVVTKEGGEKLSASAKYTTDMFMGSKSRDYNRLEASFGGPVPLVPNFNYFFSGEYTDYAAPASFMPEDGYYVLDHSKDIAGYWLDTVRYTNATFDSVTHTFTGQWMDSTDAAWQKHLQDGNSYYTLHGWSKTDKYYLPHRNFNSYRLQGKLTYNIKPLKAKFTLGSFMNRDQWGGYTYTYKYDINSCYYQLTKSFQINGTWRQQLGKNTFYTLILNYFDTKYGLGTLDTAYEKNRKFYQDVKFLSDDDKNNDGIFDAYAGQSYNYDLPDNPYGFNSNSTMQFNTRGFYRSWEHTEESYDALKLDVTSQVNRYNQVQSGLEGKQHRAYRKYNSLPWDPNPFDDLYLFRPRTAAWYLQDKLEFEGFIINAGLRLDYLATRAPYYTNQFKPEDGKTYPKPKYQLSPRLGISHPITERTAFHLSYGHFFQQPQFQYLYESLEADVVNRGNCIVGNPELKAQKNIAYEAGLAHQFSTDLAGDLTLYYKDNFNIVGGASIIDTATLNEYYGYTSTDIGNVRGIEFSIRKNPGAGIFSGRVSYSFQMAKGTSSDPTEAYFNWRGTDPATGDPLQPPRIDNSLNFDQQHTFSVTTNFDFDKSFGPKLWNTRPLSNVSINLLNNIGSGFPYTRKDSHGNVVGEYNGFRTPWTWTIDLLASKTFDISKFGFTLNFEVFNLLNRKNVLGVFDQTGKEDNDGSYKTIDQVLPTNDSISMWTTVSIDTSNGGHNGSVTYHVRNTRYSPNADLDGNGYINRAERYIAYTKAWHDIMNDPINANRNPVTRNYDDPRTMRLSLSVSF